MNRSIIPGKTTRFLTLISLLLLFTVGALGASAAQEQDEFWGKDNRKVEAALAKLKVDHPTAKVFEKNGHISRVYGTAFTSGSSPSIAAEKFRAQYAEVLGVEAVDLVPENRVAGERQIQPVMYNKETGEYKFSLVYYRQYRGSVPVFRSDLRVLVRNEADYPVVLAASDLRNLGDFMPAMSKVAFNPATEANTGMTEFSEPQTVIWAGVNDMQVAPKLAVTFSGWNDATDETHENNLYVCDAYSGEILYKESNIRFVDITGSVTAMATPGAKANICTEEVLWTYPWARIQVQGGSTYYADANGNFTIPYTGTAPVTIISYVDGLYFTIDNRAGAEETLSQLITPPGPADFIHNEANTQDLVLAQTNIYTSGNLCRDWVLEQNPSFPGISTETGVLTVVNRTDFYCPCNAWSSSGDGSINFCQPGGGCPNTAWQSVLNHEYGHHIIDFTSSGQNEYGEGMGDCIAMLPVDDPNLGYGFSGDCNSGLRTADNSCQYSATNCSSCGSEIHDCGMLLSGCVWDVRDELLITEPVDYLEIISNITVNSILLHTGSGIDQQIPIDFLTLDDNDANLDNGTPHWYEICTGFGLHGIDCPELILITFSYPNGKPDFVQPLQETAVRVTVNSGSVSPIPGSGTLYYSIDSAPFVQGTMVQISANEYDAMLPMADCDSKIDWYVTAETFSAGELTDPPTAPASYFTAVVANSITTVFADDFQTDQGWTVSGDAADGQWGRGTPIGGGDRGDPPTDYDGSGQCYLTDNVDGNSDVDDGTTILTSPVFDLSSGDAQISYARWFDNTAGSSPNADVMEIYVSNNSGLSWTLVETVGPTNQSSGGWYEVAFRASDYVTPSALMKVKFEASDLGDGSVVEAGVDAFVVSRLECESSGQVAIITETLPEWTEGVSGYSASLTALYGTAPYTWVDKFGDLTGSGLTLASDGTISGTPAAHGTYGFTAYVEDNVGSFAEKELSIVINQGPVVSTTSLPDWTAGRFYNQALAASGGTGSLSWVDYDGGLSGSGLSLTTAGQVQGTPAAAGPVSFTARVTDTPGATDEQLLSFTINPVLEITTTSPLPGWEEDEPGYSVTLEKSGGTAPFAWSNPGGGLTGTGLTLSTAGVVSGTPTTPGTINFAARVTDQSGASHNRDFEIEIYVSLTILTAPTLTAWTVGQPGYSYSLSVVGGDGNYSWTDLNGDLAGSGLSLSSAGMLTGTPTTEGQVSFVAYVADGSGQDAQRALHLQVNPWPQFDGDTVMAAWTVDHPGYSDGLSVSGGTAPMAFTTQSFNGLSLSAAGQVTGTPDQVGDLAFTAEVTDASGATASHVMVVPVNDRPTVDTETLPEWTLGHPGYNELLAASGGTGALAFSPQSFDGLNLAATGYLTGTPTALGSVGFTAEVVDAVGAAEQKALSLYINDAVAITTAATLPEATQGTAGYAVQLAATGGTGALVWSDDGGLSGSGLTLSGGGEVSGTPSVSGNVDFTAYATDAVGAEDSRLFSILVNQAYICGDGNGDDLVNITDATFLISYIFADGPAPDPYESGDADCDQVVNISDAVYLITYIFADGPEPCANCGLAADENPGGNQNR